MDAESISNRDKSGLGAYLRHILWHQQSQGNVTLTILYLMRIAVQKMNRKRHVSRGNSLYKNPCRSMVPTNTPPRLRRGLCHTETIIRIATQAEAGLNKVFSREGWRPPRLRFLAGTPAVGVSELTKTLFFVTRSGPKIKFKLSL